MNEPQMRPTRVLPTEAEVADALHADACPEDPDDGECCTCADYLREARIVLALFGQQRCAPSEDGLADVLRDILVRVFEQDKDIVAQDAARIVLDLFASQPTVAQVKAETLREYADARYKAYLDAPDTRWMDQPSPMAQRYAKASEEMHAAADRIESEG